ncbi:MAG: hypothetical protein AAFX94_08360 [Myxococcota bacterium]
MSNSGRVDNKPLVPTVHPSLNQAESQKVKQQQSNRMSPADQARLASQAGFQKLGARKKGKGIDIGDASGAPIPLPADEVDPDEWSQEKLEGAQGNLSLAASQFEEIAEEGGDIGEAVVGSSFLPTEDDVSRMQVLADREPPQPVEFEDVGTDVGRFFGIELDDTVPTGHKLLATGLVVAGESESVNVGENGADEAKLAAGVKKVAEKGNQAVSQAQMMNKGINQQVNYNRTFVVKR